MTTPPHSSGAHFRGDEFNYRDEVKRLAEWCRVNNSFFNTSKTKELIMVFRWKKTDIQPLLIDGTCVERVSNFHFLEINIMEDLTWSVHTNELAKNAQQRLSKSSQEEQHPPKTAGVLLPLLNWEHPVILSQCVVFKLHCGTEEEPTGGHKGHTENHWLPSPLSGRTSHFLLPQKGQNHSTGLITPWSHTVQTTAVRQEILVHENQNKQTTKKFLSNSHECIELCYLSIILTTYLYQRAMCNVWMWMYVWMCLLCVFSINMYTVVFYLAIYLCIYYLSRCFCTDVLLYLLQWQ